MSADVLLRVSRALQILIEREPEVGAGKVVIGPPPAAVLRLDGPRLGIFLYRVVPSAELRNRERLIPPAMPGEPAIVQAGLPLELRYLISAYGPEDEHAFGGEQLILLGAALRAVERGGGVLAELLEDQAPRLTMDPLTTEELSRIWSLFPNTSFQTSVGLVATPVWMRADLPARGRPVAETRFRYGLSGEAPS